MNIQSRTQSRRPRRSAALEQIQKEVVRCRRCPRLVRWREKVAREKIARHKDEHYWGKPVPGFGNPGAHLLVVGLAPAAHGGNRTGRMFTGDRSGNWLYRTLYKFGFANQPTSASRDDGLKLIDCYITASARCAPPLNKLLPKELKNCRPYLAREMDALGLLMAAGQPRVVITLGRVAFDTFLKTFTALGGDLPKPRPRFSHAAVYSLAERLTLIASFHPSQQNTFTGKLTEKMWDAVFHRARTIISV